MTSENNTQAERSTRDVPLVLHQYQLLSQRGFCPNITFSEEWEQYIAVGDAPSEAFETYAEYQAAFPLEIIVQADKEQLAVTEQGTGGYTRWLCRYIPENMGPGWVVLILQEAEPHFPETKINVFRGEDNLPDETENALPNLTPGVFFKEDQAKATAEKTPMVSLWMEFGEKPEELRLVPIVNQTFVCDNGLPAVANLSQEEKEAICAAWDHFSSEAVVLHLDHVTEQYHFHNNQQQ